MEGTEWVVVAAQARVTDAADTADLGVRKRVVLIACLIHTTRDPPVSLRPNGAGAQADRGAAGDVGHRARA